MADELQNDLRVLRKQRDARRETQGVGLALASRGCPDRGLQPSSKHLRFIVAQRGDQRSALEVPRELCSPRKRRSPPRLSRLLLAPGLVAALPQSASVFMRPSLSLRVSSSRKDPRHWI